MGPPVSVAVAGIVTQNIEESTLSTCRQTIPLWLRFVSLLVGSSLWINWVFRSYNVHYIHLSSLSESVLAITCFLDSPHPPQISQGLVTRLIYHPVIAELKLYFIVKS